MLNPGPMTQQMQNRQRKGRGKPQDSPVPPTPLLILHGYFLISHSRKEKDSQQPPAHLRSQLRGLISMTPSRESHHHHHHHHSPMVARISLLHAIPHPARMEGEDPQEQVVLSAFPHSNVPR